MVARGDMGLEYGPAFRGIRAAWRRGDEVFTEIELAEPYRDEAGRYCLHPALFDIATHGGFSEFVARQLLP